MAKIAVRDNNVYQYQEEKKDIAINNKQRSRLDYIR